MLVTVSSARSLRAKLGLPVLNQVAGWVILSRPILLHPPSTINSFLGCALATASVVPFLMTPLHLDPYMRIWTLFLGFTVCFVLLSISVEGMFYLVYSATLYMWTEVEAAVRAHQPEQLHKGRGTTGYQLRADDVRIAVFFLFFVQVAFFGTGKYVILCYLDN